MIVEVSEEETSKLVVQSLELKYRVLVSQIAKAVSQSIRSAEQVELLVSAAANVAETQFLYTSDRPLLQRRRNTLSSVWLYFLEKNLNVTKGR
jgi:hypothetical protein